MKKIENFLFLFKNFFMFLEKQFQNQNHNQNQAQRKKSVRSFCLVPKKKYETQFSFQFQTGKLTGKQGKRQVQVQN